MSDGEPLAVPVPARRTLKERLTAHFSEYGRIAVITYLVISLSAIVGFSIAIGMGVSPSSATGVIGVIAAGWVAAKATIPIRILITLAITPVIAFVVGRRQRRTAVAGAEPAPDDAAVSPDGSGAP